MESLSVSETVLPSGLRLVEMPVSGRLATAIAILFPAGARHERPTEVGAAHLLEHLAFKGTDRHPSAASLNRATEYLGTELAGASTVDYVEFSTFVRAESAMAAAHLLAEVVTTPRLAADDLEAERAVILQEIADDADDPGSRAHDLLLGALFAGHRLATDVAGEADDVRALTHAGVLAFRDDHWSPGGGLAVVGGNLDHIDRAQLIDLLARIPDRPAAPAPPEPPPFAPRALLDRRDGTAVHLCLAYPVPGLDCARRSERARAEVFSQLLGGPMGSRLYDELREQSALCYWVSAGISDYDGAAILFISCSVNPADVEEAYERIDAILADLKAHGPGEEEARRLRAYASGAVALEFESVNTRVDHAIELIMEHADHEVDPILVLREIEAVTRSGLAELAAAIELTPCVGCAGPTDATIF